MALLRGGSFHSHRDISDSLLKRVVENLQQALQSRGIHPTSANGAPLHFQAIDLSTRHGKSQTFSVGIHVAVLALLALALMSRPPHPPLPPTIPLNPGGNLPLYVPVQSPSAGHGSGGENDPRPTRTGFLAPYSSLPLTRPRLNHNENVPLPVPPAIFNPNEPANVPTVTNLGLPWMDRDTDSAGPGGHHGFGAGSNGNSMGDGNRDGAGEGDSDGLYAAGISPVICMYCPEPGYTEEARKAKLQGKMLLRVLVGPDGKAQRIQILQGLGMGLDERAEETIRSWRFSPGRDTAKRPVSAWVTVETRFQLF